MDQKKLNSIRQHQDQLRADVYNGLQDALTHDDIELGRIGRQVLLVSLYTGGDWCVQQQYQNATAINRYLGKPTLFITMTVNLHWLESTWELLPHQTTGDRPDIVSWVSDLKVQFLLNDLKKAQVFGRYAGSVYTIEYQKHGLHRDAKPSDTLRAGTQIILIECFGTVRITIKAPTSVGYAIMTLLNVAYVSEFMTNLVS